MSSFVGKRGQRRAPWLWAAAGLFLYLALAPRHTLHTLFRAPTSSCVVIDAGSSGTRVHVFRFRPRLGRTAWLSGQPQVLKLTPGLSSFAVPQHNAQLEAHLAELLAFAQLHVAPADRAASPIVLLATAGLRQLEPDAAEAVLSACRPLLARSGFRFQNDWAHVLAGSDEAAFAWVAANSVHNNLDVYAPASTVGVLELGGVSAQVSFVSDQIPPRAFRRDVRLPGRMRFTLFTVSFLGLGLDAATVQARAQPATALGDRCASFAACVQEAHRVLRTDEPCEEKRCLGGMPAPELRGGFVAIENLFHTVQALGLPADASLEMLQRAAEARACTEDGALPEALLSLDREPDLSRQCFNSAYVHTMLSAGFGVPVSARGAVLFTNGGVDWALGAVLSRYAPLTLAPRWLSAARVQGWLGMGLCMGGTVGVGSLWRAGTSRPRGVAAARGGMHRSISF